MAGYGHGEYEGSGYGEGYSDGYGHAEWQGGAYGTGDAYGHSDASPGAADDATYWHDQAGGAWDDRGGYDTHSEAHEPETYGAQWQYTDSSWYTTDPAHHHTSLPALDSNSSGKGGGVPGPDDDLAASLSAAFPHPVLPCPWCKQRREHRLVYQRQPPAVAALSNSARTHRSKASQPGTRHSAPKEESTSGARCHPALLRNVFQCVGCLHYTVPCLACDRAMARRGTPPGERRTISVPPPVSPHDPPVLPPPEPRPPSWDAEMEGPSVWEDYCCAACDGSLLQDSAGVLGPRMCSSCISTTFHRWRRERPGIAIGPAVSVGGRKGTAFGLGSRMGIGVGKGIDSFNPTRGQGNWLGAGDSAASIDVDGDGDYLACDSCGTHTVKCRACDVGMAIVKNTKGGAYSAPGAGTSASIRRSRKRLLRRAVKSAKSLLSGKGPSVESNKDADVELDSEHETVSHDEDTDSSSDEGSSSVEACGELDGLCVLCSGFLERDPEYQGMVRTIRKMPSTLYIFASPADPSRRDLARLLNAMFRGRIDVAPAEVTLGKWRDLDEEYVASPERTRVKGEPPEEISGQATDGRLDEAKASGAVGVARTSASRGRSAADEGNTKESSPSPVMSGERVDASTKQSVGEGKEDSPAKRKADAEEMFLPRACPNAVYAPHPLFPKTVRLLLSEFHDVLAGEKAHELETLLQAMGARRVYPRPLVRKDSLDGSSSSDSESDDLGSSLASPSMSTLGGITPKSSMELPPLPARSPMASLASGSISSGVENSNTAKTPDARVQRWRRYRLAKGAGAVSSGGGELLKRREVLMTIHKTFPCPPADRPISVPSGLHWMHPRLEPSWIEAVDSRMVDSAESLFCEITIAQSYGVDSYLNDVLLHPMIRPLGLSLGLPGAMGPAAALRVPKSDGMDGVGGSPNVDAGNDASRDPTSPSVQFVAKFIPKTVRHQVKFWPDNRPPDNSHLTFTRTKAQMDILRVQKWKKETMAADPPMWHLLKHPAL